MYEKRIAEILRDAEKQIAKELGCEAVLTAYIYGESSPQTLPNCQPRRIISVMAQTQQIDKDSLRKAIRHHTGGFTSLQRQIFAHILRHNCGMEYTEIETEINGGAGSARYAVKRMEDLLKVDPKVKTLMNAIVANMRVPAERVVK